MNRHALTLLLTVTSLLAGCARTTECSAETCPQGCCVNDECRAGGGICGSSGGQCTSCGSGRICRAGTCVTQPVVDGGPPWDAGSTDAGAQDGGTDAGADGGAPFCPDAGNWNPPLCHCAWTGDAGALSGFAWDCGAFTCDMARSGTFGCDRSGLPIWPSSCAPRDAGGCGCEVGDGGWLPCGWAYKGGTLAGWYFAACSLAGDLEYACAGP